VKLRIAQIGTRHGHGLGKWRALCANAEVEAVGVYEPDPLLRNRADYGSAHWFPSSDEILTDPSVVAVAVEGRNHESLAMAADVVRAGKHVWFDKPAGDDWPAFVDLMRVASGTDLHVQMGYMFRYSPGFSQVAELARSGQLGELFAIRAHMSTNVDLRERTEQSRHVGGILYDLGGHVLDQIVWLLGRPSRVLGVLRNDATPELPAYSDNTLAVLEFPGALATVEIAAMESRPTARRFEVYGTRGSAIIEPFDPARTLRLTFGDSEQLVSLPVVERQALYDRELTAFVAVLHGEQPPDRPPEHELLVQETLLRATGRLNINGRRLGSRKPARA
jgi:predicted dehydrogenase